MKTLHRPDHARIHRDDLWKTSAYAFVPYETHVGEFCGFADDVVAPGRGFGMHRHRDMGITPSYCAARSGTRNRPARDS